MSGAIAELRRQAEDAEARASRLQRMVELAETLGDEGLSELVALIGSDESNGNGHSSKNETRVVTERGEEVPRGREAIRLIVSARPGIWTMAELRSELKRRRWFVSNKSLDVAVSRLCASNGEARRIGRGRYVFPANHGEEAAIESDPSGGALIPFET